MPLRSQWSPCVGLTNSNMEFSKHSNQIWERARDIYLSLRKYCPVSLLVLFYIMGCIVSLLYNSTSAHSRHRS
jgi:hypothetical protein